MAGIAIQNKRKVVIFGIVGILLLSLGFLAGFFTAKHVGTSLLIQHGPPRPGETGSVYPTDEPSGHDGSSRGGPAALKLLRQLPEPWTQQGQALAASTNAADAPVRDLYTWFSDADLITEDMTVAFLEQLRGQLEANGLHTADMGTRYGNMTEVIQMFMGVARDVLSFLRARNSQALLPLLRQFASQGTITLSDVHPDVFRGEVGSLLNLTAMASWYARAGHFDHASTRTEPPAAWARVEANTPSRSEQLLTGALRPGSDAAGNRRRRLLQHSYRRQLQQGAARPGVPIPVIAALEAKAENVPPTASPLMTLNDMLCAVRHYSPTELQGMVLPRNASANSSALDRVAQPIRCRSSPELLLSARFRHGNVVFKPVKIPIVFHCQRFRQGDVLMPPLWKAEESAKNLVAVANKMFNNTFIQFTLQEVRYDVEKYPYLLLGSLKDWQECTGSPSQEDAGFPCLQETARFPEVEALIKRHVINVVIGGSQSPMFCNGTEDETCTTLPLGYTGSIGPWFTRASKTWAEDSADENWLWITWDMFSPMVKNAWRFWDGGGVTLAHELGHYLGLMHTHEGAKACEGDGLDLGDTVPDTPVNKQTVQWAAENGLAVQLAKWCAEFRQGRKPDPKALYKFNSCKQDPLYPDNVFNIESYLPDSCCMMFSRNQVARLQWAIASFRPKMMAAFAVK